MSSVPALTVGHPASHPALRAGTRSRVHSAFTHTVNLVRDDGELWTLAARDIAPGPRVVVLDLATTAPLDLRPGLRVRTTATGFALPAATITLGAARSWAPAPAHLPRHPATTGTALAAALARHGIPGGVIPDPDGTPIVAALSRLASELSLALVDDTRAGHATLPAVGRLLGVGIGTTPAGDDFLTGYAAASHARGDSATVRRIVRAIATASRRTNVIAATAIADACHGQVVAPLATLLAALAAGRDEAVDGAVRDVVALGHTSGTDLAAGVLAAVDPPAHRRWAQSFRTTPTPTAQGA